MGSHTAFDASRIAQSLLLPPKEVLSRSVFDKRVLEVGFDALR